MGAYVELIQRQERAHGVELLKHQTWSGAGLMDAQVSIATGSSTTASLGAGVTEDQFAAKALPEAMKPKLPKATRARLPPQPANFALRSSLDVP